MEIHHIEDSGDTFTLGGTKSRAFGVASTAEFINVLSDSLYSNKLLAVVREVMCNAWDAHIAAGKTDTPIKVQIDKNTLIISDEGPGIHDDLIGDIYCTYGESTKRGDSAATGGFGLGCKAPFAISDTFTVTSAHAGQKTVYTLTKSTELTDGLPELRNIVTTPCGDETGITVTIPLSADWNADTAANYARLVALWGEMLVDLPVKGIPYDDTGLPVVQMFNGEKLGLKKAPYGFVLTAMAPSYGGYTASSSSTRRVSRIHVQYGTVIYPVEYNEEYGETYKRIENILTQSANYAISTTHDSVFLLMRAEPDSLTVAPSRESLTYSKHAVATLKTMLEEAYANLSRVNPVFHQKILDHLWEEAFTESISKFDNKIHDMAELVFFIKSVLNYSHKSSRTKEVTRNIMSSPYDMHLYFLSSRYKDTRKRYNNLVKKNLIKYIAGYDNPRWVKIAKKVIRDMTIRNRDYDPYNTLRKYILRALIDKFDPELVHKYYRVVRRRNLEVSKPDRVAYSGMFDPFRLLLATNKHSIRGFLESDSEFKYNWSTAENHQIMVLPKSQKKYDIVEVADYLTDLGFRVERIYADEKLQPAKPVRTKDTSGVSKSKTKRKGYALLRDVVRNSLALRPQLDYKSKFHNAGSIEEPKVMVHTRIYNGDIVVNGFETSDKLELLLKYFPDTALVAAEQTLYRWQTKTKGMTGTKAMCELMEAKIQDQDFLNMLAYNHLLSNNYAYRLLCRIPEVSAKYGLVLPYKYEDINDANSFAKQYRYALQRGNGFTILNYALINLKADSEKPIIKSLPGMDAIGDKLNFISFFNSNSDIWKTLMNPPKDGEFCPHTGFTNKDREPYLKILMQALS